MILHRFISVCLFMMSGLLMANVLCRADIPTAEQECRIRNSAVCQSNGVQFLAEGDCPTTAQTVLPVIHNLEPLFNEQPSTLNSQNSIQVKSFNNIY